MAHYDLVISGGTVVDGLRTPRFTADLGIRDGRIAAIGSLAGSSAKRSLDARGSIVCPGFVDLHTHYDSQIFWDPYCTISGWHGVTSVVIGNCGFGFAPVKPADRMRSMLTMERNEAVRATTMAAGMPWDWETYPEFLDSLDRTPKGVNLLSYVGLNPLMTYVMGLDAAKSRPASEAERQEMGRLLGEALDAGGCGFSAQLLGKNSVQRDYDGTPMITDTMSPEDLVFFASVLRERGRGFIQVIGADPALSERLCEASGRPLVWNALVLAADQHGNTYGQYRDVIRWIDDANARGHRIFAQALTCQNNYEFSLDEWNLFDSIPAWRAVTLGAPHERAAKMRDPAHREALRMSFDPKQTLVGATVTAIPELVVTEVGKRELEEYVGFSLAEISAKLGTHPIDAMLDLALSDDLRTRFATPPQKIDMAAMREVVNSPFALPGVSDGGAHMKFLTLGRYPTEFLSLLVRDNGLMDLEQAHWRLSAYPAMAAGIRDRGFLREGAPADVLVYDLAKLRILPAERVHDFPAGDWRLSCKADGYRAVIVNGEITFEDGVCTGATPGRLLRHGQSA
jgi:N-acyl-D-aspartate/D-glutamate deacylase